MAVARDDLSRKRIRLEAEPLARDAFDVRLELRVGPDGARQLPHAIRLERTFDAHARTVELERPAGKLPAERRRLRMDAVRPADADGVAVLLARAYDRFERTVDSFQDQMPGVLDLQRKCGVDDVRGRQPVVHPASGFAELLRYGVDESGDVVVGDAFDLGDALGSRHLGPRADLRNVAGRDAPTSAQASRAASSTSSQRASRFSSDQIVAMAGRA